MHRSGGPGSNGPAVPAGRTRPWKPRGGSDREGLVRRNAWSCGPGSIGGAATSMPSPRRSSAGCVSSPRRRGRWSASPSWLTGRAGPIAWPSSGDARPRSSGRWRPTGTASGARSRSAPRPHGSGWPGWPRTPAARARPAPCTPGRSRPIPAMPPRGRGWPASIAATPSDAPSPRSLNRGPRSHQQPASNTRPRSTGPSSCRPSPTMPRRPVCDSSTILPRRPSTSFPSPSAAASLCWTTTATAGSTSIAYRAALSTNPPDPAIDCSTIAATGPSRTSPTARGSADFPADMATA